MHAYINKAELTHTHTHTNTHTHTPRTLEWYKCQCICLYASVPHILTLMGKSQLKIQNVVKAKKKMYKVYVQKIEGFANIYKANTAGFLDEADLYVKIIVGTKDKRELKTQVVRNKGGSATFDQTFLFEQVSELISYD